MVKKFYLVPGLILFVVNCFSQSDKDTSIHKTAMAVCSCLEINNIDTISTDDEMQQVFFKCIMDSASEKIADVMLGGTVTNPETVAEDFGTRLAVEMLNSGCKPFVQMSLKLGKNSSNSANKSNLIKTAEGEVIKVEERDFLYISMKTVAGREISLIYMSYVPGSDEWIKNPAMLEHKKVSVKWIETETYQPKLKEFVNIREIKELHIE